MALLRLLAWCAPSILVLACTSKPEAPTPSPGKVERGKVEPVEPASLEGRVFLAQRVTEGGKPRALVEGSGLTISFHEGSRVGANAGCNSLGGGYAIVGGALVISEATITEKACPNVMDQESWYMGLLESKPTLARDGDTLVLEGGGTRIEYLDREVAMPDVALEGRTWTVDTILTPEAASQAAESPPATLTFAADGSVEIFDGCNKGSRTYEIKGKELTFGSRGWFTQMHCDGPFVDELENAVRGILGGAQPVTWEIDVDRLSLRNKDGHGLDLKASKG